MIPKTISDFNFFVDGGSYLGIAEDVTLPKLTRKMEDYQGGGMRGPIDLDVGMEKMEMSFTLKEFSRPILEKYGICDAAGVALRIRAASHSNDSACEVDTIEIIVRGRLKEIDQGDLKQGENASMKAQMSLSYYKYSINGDDVIEIDFINNIEVVNGVDHLRELRDALAI